MDFLRYSIVMLLLLPASSVAIGFYGEDLQGLPCRGNAQGYGPYDYTNPVHFNTKLSVVEDHHFTSEVEQLKRRANVGYNLDYTIRAFPNHHRALFATIRYATDGRYKKLKKLVTSPECYLQRAIRFQPKDGNVYLLYGLYLHKLKRLQDAESYYKQALELIPNSAEANYNYGLLLTDMERFKEAQPYARKAYKLGYPLPGLKRRLASAGFPLKP